MRPWRNKNLKHCSWTAMHSSVQRLPKGGIYALLVWQLYRNFLTATLKTSSQSHLMLNTVMESFWAAKRCFQMMIFLRWVTHMKPQKLRACCAVSFHPQFGLKYIWVKIWMEPVESGCISIYTDIFNVMRTINFVYTFVCHMLVL